MEVGSELKPAKFGLIGFLFGVAGLLIIFIQISTFFEPQPKSSGSVIGEIAADIKQSAKRALTGEPAPEPEPVPTDYGPVITIGALCLAAIGIVSGGLGLFKNEPRRLAYLGIGFGVAAFMMQYVFWLAILVCGVVLLVSIIGNLDSIFSG